MRLTSKINIALRLYGYYNEGGKRGVLHRARTLLEYYRSRYPEFKRQGISISALLAGNLYAMKKLRRTYVRGIA